MNSVQLSDNMGIRFKHIFMALAASVLLLASCRNEGPKVIDEDDMSKIYAEMLMSDQWINNTPGVRKIADTSLVYEPILAKYGYTSEDYRHSVSHYLDEPEKYAEVMEETVKILDGKLSQLRKEKQRQLKEEERVRYVKSITKKVEMDESLLIPRTLSAFSMNAPEDSMILVLDSLLFYYKWEKMQADSLSVADTLAISDSLNVVDTLAVADTLVLADTLRKPDTLRHLLNTGRFIKSERGMKPFKIEEYAN